MGIFSHHVLSSFILTPPAFLPHSPLQLSTSIVMLYRYCNPNLSSAPLVAALSTPRQAPQCVPAECLLWLFRMYRLRVQFLR